MLWHALRLLLTFRAAAGASAPLIRRAVSEPSPTSLLELSVGSGVPNCGARRNPRCSERSREPEDTSPVRAAVYTYNLGGYEEPRSRQVPCVPSNVDAFLFLDATTKKKAPKAALTHWQRQGWQIKIVPLEKATRYVSAERLTSKSLKFAPPSWLLSGKWDWLIGYDHDMTINLRKLPEFLSNHDNKPLLMLKWYWRNCDNDAFDCMLWEMDDMLTKRPEYVRSSRKNIEHWKDLMTTMHHATKPFTPLHYFESCVIFRNLNHERAGDVKTAFERTYNMSHDIQRDQFLVPYYLWRDGLSSELGAMHLSELQQELDFCSVPTKRKRN